MKKLIEKYNHLSAPARATIWFTICNLVLKGISLVTVPIFTRILSDEQYGILSIFLSYEQLLLILATWEIQNGAYQKAVFKYRDDIQRITTSTLILINILTLICFGILFLFIDFIVKITGMPKWLLSLLMVYLLFQPAYTCWLVRKRTIYDYKPAVIATIAYSLINVVIPMSALFLLGKTAYIKYAFTLVPSIIFCSVIYFKSVNFSLFKGKMQIVKEQWKFLLRFEAPLVLHSLSYLILNQADRIMIGSIVGSSKAAYYSVAYSLASIVIIFQNSVNQALLPWRYEMLEKKQYKKISDVTSYLLMAMGIIVLLAILIMPEIMKILFTHSYYEAIWSIPPITVSVYFMFLYTIFVNIESYFEKTKYVMYVSVSCSVINIVLNYICISTFGYIACGYTTLISYILFAVGHFCFMKKIIKENSIEVNVVNGKNILIISSIVVGVSLIFTVCYSFCVIRYCILGFLCICLLGSKKTIKKIISQIKDDKFMINN